MALLRAGSGAFLMLCVLGATTGFGAVALAAKAYEKAPAPGAVTANGYHRTWWKEAVVYQIYPRSFQDSNGDGIGT